MAKTIAITVQITPRLALATPVKTSLALSVIIATQINRAAPIAPRLTFTGEI